MPNWDMIRQEWETSKITLTALADKYEVKLGTLKSRRSREEWTRNATKKDATISERMQPKEPVVLNDDLTEKQKLFCIYYIKCFNQTLAAIKAGYASDSAHVEGHRLLKNAKVAEEIHRLKGEMQQGIFIDAMDVLNKYIRIAFADIADVVNFKPGFVTLKKESEMDTSIISEIGNTESGIKVKLLDKMKALEMLTKYFDLLPDAQKRRLEEEKLKLEIAQMTGDSENDAHEQGSSYEAALNAQVEDVFADEEA